MSTSERVSLSFHRLAILLAGALFVVGVINLLQGRAATSLLVSAGAFSNEFSRRCSQCRIVTLPLAAPMMAVG